MKTRGPQIAKWIEAMLVHGEGDYYGQPFRLRDFQREFLDDLYTVNGDNGRVVRRALWGLPKGNGKTEFAAAVGMAELMGPFAPTSPNVVVAAAGYDQADLVFGAMRIMGREGPLAPFVDVYERRITRKDKPGRAQRVAAVAGPNDGLRPTCFIADEVHEWIGSKERVHVVLGNSLAKRRDGLELNITTAGWDTESLLHRLYAEGRKVSAGEVDDPGFLFRWSTVDLDEINPDDPDEVREAVLAANPVADDLWPADNLLRRWREIPWFEFARYHLNAWTTTDTQWLPAQAWAELADTARTVEPGTPIVVGFDGSYNGDSSGLVGVTLDDKPHVFVLGVWENPHPDKDGWLVPAAEVDARVEDVFTTYDVRSFVADKAKWVRQIQEWANRYGTPPVLEWPQSIQRMVPAFSTLYTAAMAGDFTHDGNPTLARHIANGVARVTRDGVMVEKDRPGSPRKIDLLDAAAMAYLQSTREDETTEVGVLFV